MAHPWHPQHGDPLPEERRRATLFPRYQQPPPPDVLQLPVFPQSSQQTVDLLSGTPYDAVFPWFWIDLETSGISVSNSVILEIAVIVTDRDLVMRDSLHLVLHHPMRLLMSQSSQWCRRKFCSPRHGGNGLFESSDRSTTSHADALQALWLFFMKHSCAATDNAMGPLLGGIAGAADLSGLPAAPEPNPFSRPGHFQHSRRRRDRRDDYTSSHVRRRCMLAGSSVHFDRGFLLYFFPTLECFLHYRMVDVSSLLEMTKRWSPALCKQMPKPKSSHRALDDLIDSISLMRFLRSSLFPQ